MEKEEFPKGKERYCPRCYFENDVVALKEKCSCNKKYSNKNIWKKKS